MLTRHVPSNDPSNLPFLTLPSAASPPANEPQRPTARQELHLTLGAGGRGSRPELAEAPPTRTLVIDRTAYEVSVDGQLVELTVKEFAILAYLADHPGHVFSRRDLLSAIWGEHHAAGSRTVDVHVSRLRSKLGTRFPLLTVRGIGYKLRARPPAGGTHPISAHVHST